MIESRISRGIVLEIAFVAAIIGFTLYLDWQFKLDAEQDLKDLRTRVSEALAREQRFLVDSVQSEVESLNEQLSVLQALLAEIRANQEMPANVAVNPAPVHQTPDQSAEARAALKDQLEQAQEAADAAGERAATMFSAIDTDSEAFQHMSEVQANAQVDMVYADMFDELALPPDRAAAVRQVLIDSTLDEMRSGIEAMRDGKAVDAEAQTAANDAREEQLRADLRSILTPEEFARWEQYADTKPARMLASSYDMQLNSLAPGLSLENRQLARDVLVEETLLLQTDSGDPFAGFADPETSIQTQAQILENAANRLATVFDAQQMERFQAFADYQLSLMESATRLMQ